MADIVFPGSVAGGPLGSDYLPTNYDLVLYRGDYFSFSITLKDSLGAPINLVGYSAQSSIRESFDAATSYDAVVAISAPSTGVIDVTFTSAVTEDLEPGDYIWDFQVTEPSGNKRTYLAGDVKVYGEVTKP